MQLQLDFGLQSFNSKQLFHWSELTGGCTLRSCRFILVMYNVCSITPLNSILISYLIFSKKVIFQFQCLLPIAVPFIHQYFTPTIFCDMQCSVTRYLAQIGCTQLYIATYVESEITPCIWYIHIWQQVTCIHADRQ